jgi:transposase
MKIPEHLVGLSKREIIRRHIILESRIEELERRLAMYENAHTPPSQQRKYPKREKSNNQVGAPKGHEGKTRDIPKPNRFKELKLSKCPDCDKRLGRPVSIHKKIIEDIPDIQPLKITQFTIPHYFCNDCDKKVIPNDSELPFEGIFGPNLLAEINLMKYEDRLPYRKIANTLNRQYGLQLTPATILDITRRVADKLENTYKEIKQQVSKSSQVNVDETGIKVKGKKLWLWAFVSLTSILYLIRPNRGQKTIKEILDKDYPGILTCDGWRSYPKCVKKLQRCWAHLLREAKWFAEKYEGQARLLYNDLCKLFQRIKRVPSYKYKAWITKTYDFCMNEMRSLIRRCEAYTKLRKFTTKLENGLEHWFTCVLHPEIEPTNNKAERALRELVVQRKISSLWNQKGIRIKEIVMSVLATWNLQGLNTFSMLRKTLIS